MVKPRIRSYHLLIALLLLFVPVSLSLTQDDDVNPAALPLLEPGLHLGTTFFGGGEVPEDTPLMQIVEDAAAQGMSAFTFYVDWSNLEPTPGVYALDDLEASLSWYSGMGIQPLLNISFIDISDLTLPDDLLNDDATTLADGMAFDDERVFTRLTGLLDEVVPLLAEHNGFLLLLGNEVDSYFADFPDADMESYVRLIAAARDYVHEIMPEMAVGVTLTGTEVWAQGDLFQALTPVTDVIPFNYYPLVTDWGDEWFNVLPLPDMRTAIEDYMAIYGDRPVVITELGCPSAAANTSSPEIQAECFDVMLRTLADYPNVRYVTVFTLFDFDESTCDLIVEVFGFTEADLPDGAFDRWRGYLCELGILNADYAPKPAWDVFMDYAG